MVASTTTRDGVLYTEHVTLKSEGPIASLWSFESIPHTSARPVMVKNADGNLEFWLDRSDPLLNTILPGTGATVVINFGDRWSVGRSLRTASELPAVFVVGPVLRPRLQRVGRSVRAIGAGFPAMLTRSLLNVHPSKLIDRILPLHSIWPIDDVETLTASLAAVPMPAAVAMLKDALIERRGDGIAQEHFAHQATQLMRTAGGRVSITELADRFQMSRQKFAREFIDATGFTPKVYARLTRFQSLLRRLLTSDVSEWASISSDAGFYDQAHMINEFRDLAGVPPIEFFRPHGESAKALDVSVRGRPSQWVKR
jgi:AraC-like DNA-binding protein